MFGSVRWPRVRRRFSLFRPAPTSHRACTYSEDGLTLFVERAASPCARLGRGVCCPKSRESAVLNRAPKGVLSRRRFDREYADNCAAVSVRFSGSLDAVLQRKRRRKAENVMASTTHGGAWREGPVKRDVAAPAKLVEIKQQFRERHNMTYEIDCSGISLVLRVFFPAEGVANAPWRIEASAGATQPVSASASSRSAALRDIAESWRGAAPAAVWNVDWSGVAQAMTSVRAL